MWADSTLQETLRQLEENIRFTAFLGCWRERWPLRITGDDGWLGPEQRAQFLQPDSLGAERGALDRAC